MEDRCPHCHSIAHRHKAACPFSHLPPRSFADIDYAEAKASYAFREAVAKFFMANGIGKGTLIYLGTWTEEVSGLYLIHEIRWEKITLENYLHEVAPIVLCSSRPQFAKLPRCMTRGKSFGIRGPITHGGINNHGMFRVVSPIPSSEVARQIPNPRKVPCRSTYSVSMRSTGNMAVHSALELRRTLYNWAPHAFSEEIGTQAPEVPENLKDNVKDWVGWAKIPDSLDK